MLKPRTTTIPSPNWRALYQAALFETDRRRLPERIAAAERALILRGRELFSAEIVDFGEQREVNNALYALHALENCLGIKRATA
jgi:hypothetical protein